MAYRDQPPCPDPDYETGPSFQEELRLFDKQIKAISVTALSAHLLVLVYYFLYR